MITKDEYKHFLNIKGELSKRCFDILNQLNSESMFGIDCEELWIEHCNFFEDEVEIQFWITKNRKTTNYGLVIHPSIIFRDDFVELFVEIMKHNYDDRFFEYEYLVELEE